MIVHLLIPFFFSLNELTIYESSSSSDSTNHGSKIFREVISEMSKKQTWICNNLHSIYIVFTIICILLGIKMNL